MFRLSVVNGIGKGERTAVILGEAVFTHARELQSALGEALAGCDHLTVEVGKVQVLDLTFRAVLCSLHRHSKLVHKEITLHGSLPNRMDRQRYCGLKVCLPGAASERCQLWDSIFPGPGEARAEKGR